MTVILILFVILVVAIFLSGNYEMFENTPVIPQLPPVPYGTAVGANAGSNNSGFNGISSYDEINSYDGISSYDTANDALYKERIINKVPPPNVYLTDEMEYSPETVMANVNDVRQEVQRYQMELPNLVGIYVNDHMRQLDR